MNINQWMKRQGLTPRKCGLIGVLAVVFMGVLIYQFSGTGGPSADAGESVAGERETKRTRASATAVAAAAKLASRAPRTIASEIDPQAWKKLPRQQVMQYDFFFDHNKPRVVQQSATPAIGLASHDEQQESTRQQAQALQRLKQAGVSFIMEDDSGQIAVIDSKLVRVGDVVDGYRVVAIDQHGLALEVVAAKTN